MERKGDGKGGKRGGGGRQHRLISCVLQTHRLQAPGAALEQWQGKTKEGPNEAEGADWFQVLQALLASSHVAFSSALYYSCVCVCVCVCACVRACVRVVFVCVRARALPDA